MRERERQQSIQVSIKKKVQPQCTQDIVVKNCVMVFKQKKINTEKMSKINYVVKVKKVTPPLPPHITPQYTHLPAINFMMLMKE